MKKCIKIKNFCDTNHHEKLLILNWRNHESIRQWMYSQEIIPVDNHLKHIDGLNNCDNKLYWIVYVNNVPSGVISLTDINRIHSRANGGLYVAPEITTKGMGEVLLSCLCDQAFSNLGLHILRLEALDTNLRANKFYIRFGCLYEGKYRDYVKTEDGTYIDVNIYSIRERDYENR